MLLNFILCFSTYDFGIRRFNATNETFSLPHIIFPYFPYQSEVINISNRILQESVENATFVASSIDCSSYTTVCSIMKLKPGSMYVSFPPHKNPKASNRAITYDNARQLAEDISVKGLYEFKSAADIQKAANTCPLFCLVARSNAGDLEVKRPIVEELAKLYIHRNLRFGFVTDFALYEKYAHHPLTAFVFISPSLQHATHRGDFTLETLAEFIAKYEQPVWSDPLPPKGVALTMVDDKINDNIVSEFSKHQTHFPMVFIDNADVGKAAAICKGESKCLAAVDFKKFRSIVIPNSEETTTEEKLQALKDFATAWNNLTIADKMKNTVELVIYSNFNTFIGCGCAAFLVFGLAGFFVLDKKKEIYDTRKAAKMVKKTK